MKENFERAINLVLKEEGGWSDHPEDNGGATMRGVIQRVYDAYRKNKDLPLQSVRKITDKELTEIYKKQYWDAIKGDLLPSGVDYCVFDVCVNSGSGQATKFLQRALSVKVDGQVGEVTLAAVKLVKPETVIRSICEQRRVFFKRLKDFKYFGKGWMSRVNRVEPTALLMAKGAVMESTKFDIGETKKAKPEDVAVSKTGEIKGAAISTLGTVGAAVNDVIEKIQPLAEGIEIIKYICVGLIIIGLTVTVYSFYKRVQAGEVVS